MVQSNHQPSILPPICSLSGTKISFICLFHHMAHSSLLQPHFWSSLCAQIVSVWTDFYHNLRATCVSVCNTDSVWYIVYNMLYYEIRPNNGFVHAWFLPLGFWNSRFGSLKRGFLENYIWALRSQNDLDTILYSRHFNGTVDKIKFHIF